MEKKGIALGYSPGQDAPRIIATARGFLVDRLIEKALENGITIYKDADLAEVLSVMNPGDEIPENLFYVISEVLAFCYNVNDEFKEKIKNYIP